MIKINRYISKTVLAVLVLGFLMTSSVLAADEDARFKPIADEMIGASGISWSPKVNYYQLILTIARPDGSVFSKTFDAGSTPYVDLSSIFGESVDDGSYTYELRLIPRFERRARGGNQDTIVTRTQDRRHLPRKSVTQSGGFTVKNGMIVTDSITEPEAPGVGSLISTSTAEDGISRINAQTITTDLIVQGSACVGVDCSSSESFGFDTIRLKENNLRIKFQDTSNSSSFPSNDWQLTANESSNGGKNKFSIDDIDGGRTPFTIEASAPNNSIYVEDGGNVGFGTATPVVDLHAVSGNTPTLRLEQDGSSGFTAQTWDIAGNEANFFIRDVTHSSNLPFRIKPGSGNDDAIYIDSNGDIGYGTDSPGNVNHLTGGGTDSAVKAHLKSNGNVKLVLDNSSNNVGLVFTAGGTQTHIGSMTDHEFRFYVNNDWRMRLNNSSSTKDLEMRDGAYSDGTDWFPSSSRELKENIKNLTVDEAMEALENLTPVKYNYKSNKEEARVGFIAEDVPEIVAVNGRKHLNSMDIVAVLTKVVQKQQSSIQEQQQVISELKTKVTELEKNQ
jgi:hypothetical protein